MPWVTNSPQRRKMDTVTCHVRTRRIHTPNAAMQYRGHQMTQDPSQSQAAKNPCQALSYLSPGCWKNTSAPPLTCRKLASVMLHLLAALVIPGMVVAFAGVRTTHAQLCAIPLICSLLAQWNARRITCLPPPINTLSLSFVDPCCCCHHEWQLRQLGKWLQHTKQVCL
jgi:hypothetical protein